jgi:hypothetical protein
VWYSRQGILDSENAVSIGELVKVTELKISNWDDADVCHIGEAAPPNSIGSAPHPSLLPAAAIDRVDD